MMEGFNINNYLEKLILQCKESFGGRLVYVGLQGSWLRGEATENSDIDDLSYAYWLGYIYRCECIMHDESSRMVYSAFTEDIMRKAYTDVVNSPMNDRNLSDCAKEICADLDRLLVEKIWPEKKHRKYM